jgi:hypothetical protein
MFLLTILNKDPLVFDSGYLFGIEVDDFKLKLIVFVSSLIYFIPVISLVGYSIQLIFVTHYVLKKCKGER